MSKQERIEVRSSEEEKKEFEEAAALVHLNIKLSKEEGIRFLEALDHPPEPNKKLKEAMRRHEKNIKKRVSIGLV